MRARLMPVLLAGLLLCVIGAGCSDDASLDAAGGDDTETVGDPEAGPSSTRSAEPQGTTAAPTTSPPSTTPTTTASSAPGPTEAGEWPGPYVELPTPGEDYRAGIRAVNPQAVSGGGALGMLRVGEAQRFEFDAAECELGSGRRVLGSFDVDGQFANVEFDDPELRVALADGRIFSGEAVEIDATGATGDFRDLSALVALGDGLTAEKVLEVPAWSWELILHC